MKTPDKVRELANVGLEEAYRHPQHHFDWRIRRQIYRLFTMYPLGSRVHDWLAVLTAERVLPIFSTTFPDDDLPPRLFEAAKRIAEDPITVKEIDLDVLLSEGYHGVGLDATQWHNKIALNAEYAGFAAYKALVEVSGNYDLLGGVGKIKRGTYPSGESVMSIGGTDTIAIWETGDTFSDEDIAHLAAYSDTASAGAMASACAEAVF